MTPPPPPPPPLAGSQLYIKFTAPLLGPFFVVALNIRKTEIYASILFTAECVYSDRKGGGGGGFELVGGSLVGRLCHPILEMDYPAWPCQSMDNCSVKFYIILDNLGVRHFKKRKSKYFHSCRIFVIW